MHITTSDVEHQHLSVHSFARSQPLPIAPPHLLELLLVAKETLALHPSNKGVKLDQVVLNRRPRDKKAPSRRATNGVAALMNLRVAGFNFMSFIKENMLPTAFH